MVCREVGAVKSHLACNAHMLTVPPKSLSHCNFYDATTSTTLQLPQHYNFHNATTLQPERYYMALTLQPWNSVRETSHLPGGRLLSKMLPHHHNACHALRPSRGLLAVHHLSGPRLRHRLSCLLRLDGPQVPTIL